MHSCPITASMPHWCIPTPSQHPYPIRASLLYWSIPAPQNHLYPIETSLPHHSIPAPQKHPLPMGASLPHRSTPTPPGAAARSALCLSFPPSRALEEPSTQGEMWALPGAASQRTGRPVRIPPRYSTGRRNPPAAHPTPTARCPARGGCRAN